MKDAMDAVMKALAKTQAALAKESSKVPRGASGGAPKPRAAPGKLPTLPGIPVPPQSRVRQTSGRGGSPARGPGPRTPLIKGKSFKAN